MLILLSPSKTLDFESDLPKNLATTTPIFQKESDLLAAEMKKLSAKQIAKTMKVSEKIAELNYNRFQNFAKTKSRPAIFSFIGDVYRDIHPFDYSKQELAFAQDHIRTLSGLYGVLKPLDLIKPYRLEMHHKTNFWKTKLTAALKKESQLLINLASEEYSKPINLKEFETYTPIFKEKKGQDYKIIPLYSKIARGTLANWIIKNQITNPKQIIAFNEDRYKFAPKLSDSHNFIFTRG